MTDFERRELPRGWVWTTLGEVVDPSSEKTDPRAAAGSPYVGLEHIDKNTGRILGQGDSTDVRSTKALFRPGDVLYGRLRPYLNKVCSPDFAGVCSTDILVFRQSPSMTSRYLLYRLLSSDFVEYASRNVSGVQHPRVDLPTLSAFPLSLPPVREQVRITAELEELFTQLDAGVEALQKVKAQLQRYRQAVLKAAFEGRLTEKCRARTDIPASLMRPEAIGLPETWVRTPLAQLGELNRGKSKHRPRNDPRLYGGTHPFVQTGDVANSGGYVRQYTQTYNERGLAQSHLWPANTLCITIAANIAATGLLTFPACFPDSIVGFVADESVCCVRYVQFFIDHIRSRIEAEAPATAQKNINLEILRNLTVPLPPVAEQQEIVEEIDRRLSVADELEAAVDQGLKRAERLRQGILKRAFEGKLVAQDPADEPAAVLLERVRPARSTKDAKSRERREGRRHG